MTETTLKLSKVSDNAWFVERRNNLLNFFTKNITHVDSRQKSIDSF